MVRQEVGQREVPELVVCGVALGQEVGRWRLGPPTGKWLMD